MAYVLPPLFHDEPPTVALASIALASSAEMAFGGGAAPPLALRAQYKWSVAFFSGTGTLDIVVE